MKIDPARVEQGRIATVPDRQPRQGWKEAFAAAGSYARDSSPLDALPPSEFDDHEWIW
jgi:hypothetical protein